jgi:hypothetical protein
MARLGHAQRGSATLRAARQRLAVRRCAQPSKAKFSFGRAIIVGRLTEYFGRLNRRKPRTTEPYPGQLPAYVADTVKRIRGMKVSAARLAEHEARQRLVAKPGPLQPGWTPDGLTARQVAAARATQAMAAMRREGETPQLSQRFDAAYDSIEGKGWGAKVRDLCFRDTPEPVSVSEMNATTVCKKIDGMMTISAC